MQRRTFLWTAVAATATNALAHTMAASVPAKSFVVKAGKGRFGEQTRLGGVNPNDIKVSVDDTGGQLSVLEYTGHQKGGPPLHIHPHQDEIFYVLDGQYLFQVGNEQQTLTAGDLIFLPRNVPHTFAQLSDAGRLLFFFQPAGKMENYFRTLGKLSGPPSPPEGAKIFADHDMQVVGPPLAIH
ncbi:cupin domain-containing protein [Rudanella paleaurantiibacter]|uniref:Cupin domain-containing protein n=1 Tax=Rudanella paleaurantiibacter TaxID=2614655 RepID=A0A7J5TZZ6_9BACT|nr:cupin domain-containing protein [Rudanella paleaurantiibacter]KAB7731020.1 cupin domain-containing protein [Rudanella paleaurantiibacter]